MLRPLWLVAGLLLLSQAMADDTQPCKADPNDATIITCSCSENTTVPELMESVVKTVKDLTITKCTFDEEADGGMFEGYDSLRSLDLEKNTVSNFSSPFSKLNKLTTLKMKGNELTGNLLRPDVFTGLDLLETLDLGDNKIDDFPNAPTFSQAQLPKLTTLNLDGNKLTTLNVGPFYDLNVLTELDVEENVLTTVDLTADKTPFPSLKTLKLGNNQLTILEAACLSGLKSLKELDLANNQLTDIASNAFKDVAGTLTTVEFYNNKLTPTLSEAFKDLEKLSNLDVSDNQLYWMYEDTLRWDGLTQFDVHTNPWECDCRNAWLITRPVVKDTAPHKDVPNNITCASPIMYKNKSVFDVPKAFDCPQPCHDDSRHQMGVGFGVGLLIGVLLAVIAFVIYCRLSSSKRRSGQYSHHINS